MKIKTNRLIISDFTTDMAHAVHLNSIDEDNRRFVPDEVFESDEEALETIKQLLDCYNSPDGPFVHPVLLKDGTVIGYVQTILLNDSWEVGYHIGKNYTGNGYATEALKAFLPQMAKRLQTTVFYGICLADNVASAKVMQKCGFEKIFDGKGLYQGEQRHVSKFVYRC